MHHYTSQPVVVTGILGQDGYFLASELVHRGLSVVGTTHRSGLPEEMTIGGKPIRVKRLDPTSPQEINDFVSTTKPVAIFNLAARASSSQLFDDPLATIDTNALSVGYWLECLRTRSQKTKFIQASSCEVFSGSEESPQNEKTRYVPTSAYGASKAFADHLINAYRSTHGIFAASAILYPHESPRRDRHFLVRKVVSAAVRFKRGDIAPLRLGDLEAIRDWGYAGDHMRGVAQMMDLHEPHDFVFGTGVGHTVGDVCRAAFDLVGLTASPPIHVDESLVRRSHGAPAIADARKAERILDWTPRVSFMELIELLVEHEMRVNE